VSRICRRQEYERLLGELHNEGYRSLLLKLQNEHPFLTRFSDWEAVVSFVHEGLYEDSRIDEILRPIFESHRQDGDPRWRNVLMVVFWPALEGIHMQRRGWDPDPEERWQNIVWTFLEYVSGVDMSARRDHLVRKVYNDTAKRLYEGYRKRAGWQETQLDEEMEERLVDEVVETAEERLRNVRRVQVEKLKTYRRSGLIDKEDLLVLIATRVYGRSLADYARERGMGYDMARKRRKRAEEAILHRQIRKK
jgi:hypothetical protein